LSEVAEGSGRSDPAQLGGVISGRFLHQQVGLLLPLDLDGRCAPFEFHRVRREQQSNEVKTANAIARLRETMWTSSWAKSHKRHQPALAPGTRQG
jgi:hypothetical protein